MKTFTQKYAGPHPRKLLEGENFIIILHCANHCDWVLSPSPEEVPENVGLFDGSPFDIEKRFNCPARTIGSTEYIFLVRAQFVGKFKIIGKLFNRLDNAQIPAASLEWNFDVKDLRDY